MSETLNLLAWVSRSSNDVVKMFFGKLCETNGYSDNVSAKDLYSEIKLNGGNTFVNLFRGDGVEYKALTYDVAEALRGFFEDRPYNESNLDTIERYILQKMEVSDEMISNLCDAINSDATKDTVKDQAQKVIVKGVAYVAGVKVAEKAAESAAQQALKEALKKKAGQEVAKKAAKEAAKRAAKKAAESAAQKVAEQVLARILAALNVILIAWTIIDLAGPAMRKTMPSATYIALLRQLKKNEERNV